MRCRSHLFVICALAVCILGASAIVTSEKATEVHGIDITWMDASVRPGDDFFSYANGNWVKITEIPADQSRWSTFRILREEAAKRTAGLLQDAANNKPAPGSNAQKVGDYYASFMDEATIEKTGLAPLQSALDRVA